MTAPDGRAGDALEQALAAAVDAAIERVIADTTARSAGARNAYGGLRDPIYAKLLLMDDGQAFEVTFGTPEAADAFAAGFNEQAPRTGDCIFGAVADGSVLSLKRMAPVGFIIKDGKQVPI